MSSSKFSRLALEQLAVFLVVALLELCWFAIWGPPGISFREIVTTHKVMVLGIFLGMFVTAELLLLVARRRVLRNRRPSTPLSRATFWLGFAASISLFTGVLLGWIALFAAPAGLLTGVIVLARESRTGPGHSLENLLGIALSVGAIVFLLS